MKIGRKIQRPNRRIVNQQLKFQLVKQNDPVLSKPGTNINKCYVGMTHSLKQLIMEHQYIKY